MVRRTKRLLAACFALIAEVAGLLCMRMPEASRLFLGPELDAAERRSLVPAQRAPVLLLDRWGCPVGAPLGRVPTILDARGSPARAAGEQRRRQLLDQDGDPLPATQLPATHRREEEREPEGPHHFPAHQQPVVPRAKDGLTRWEFIGLNEEPGQREATAFEDSLVWATRVVEPETAWVAFKRRLDGLVCVRPTTRPLTSDQASEVGAVYDFMMSRAQEMPQDMDERELIAAVADSIYTVNIGKHGELYKPPEAASDARGRDWIAELCLVGFSVLCSIGGMVVRGLVTA